MRLSFFCCYIHVDVNKIGQRGEEYLRLKTIELIWYDRIRRSRIKLFIPLKNFYCHFFNNFLLPSTVALNCIIDSYLICDRKKKKKRKEYS